jgi:hypothetical protein
MTRMSVPSIGARVPIPVFILVLMLGLTATSARAFDEVPLWPGKTVTWSNGATHEWPLFALGHEMDYLTHAWWSETHPTWESTECGYMKFKPDGTIVFYYYMKRKFVKYLESYKYVKCSDLYHYKIIKISPEYIVLFVDYYRKFPRIPKVYINFDFWVLSRFDDFGLFRLFCHYNFTPEIEAKVRSLTQAELLDLWGRAERCNPDLMPPDRDYFWMEKYQGATYDEMNIDLNPR